MSWLKVMNMLYRYIVMWTLSYLLSFCAWNSNVSWESSWVCKGYSNSFVSPSFNIFNISTFIFRNFFIDINVSIFIDPLVCIIITLLGCIFFNHGILWRALHVSWAKKVYLLYCCVLYSWTVFSVCIIQGCITCYSQFHKSTLICFILLYHPCCYMPS